MYGPHILTLETETPVIVGRWLTLDALLDGILEREGIHERERVLPLTARSSTGQVRGLTARRAAEIGHVFCASSLFPGDHSVRTAGLPGAGPDLVEAATFSSGRPRVRSHPIVGGTRPLKDFPDDQFPFQSRGNKFETTRRETASLMDTRKALDPGQIAWFFQGDGDAVVEIVKLAVGIGAKISSGNGAIIPGSIVATEVDPGDVTSLFGIVNADGSRLLRPVPVGMFPELADIRSRRAVETCWPPYWEQSRATDAIVPAVTHYDGILSLS